jgi:5'-methylthioadenosine phosphorylase
MGGAGQAEIGIFGGTGLYEMEGLGDARDLDVETPFGKPSSRIRVGTLEGRRVAFLSRHDLGHRLLPSEIPYRANVYAMKTLGVGKVVSAGAVGSLREDLPPRTLVVPDQFIDRTHHRPDTFFGEGVVVHVSLADPFAPAVRRALVEGARATGHDVRDGGSYLCMEGPQFSTRAESVWYRAMGCHVIGMTAITEARLCREAEIAYAALSLVTDYDAWRPHEAGVDASEILAVLKENVQAGREVVRAAVARIPTGDLPENRSLESAIVTPLDRIPAETRRRLLPILRPYIET